MISRIKILIPLAQQKQRLKHHIHRWKLSPKELPLFHVSAWFPILRFGLYQAIFRRKLEHDIVFDIYVVLFIEEVLELRWFTWLSQFREQMLLAFAWKIEWSIIFIHEDALLLCQFMIFEHQAIIILDVFDSFFEHAVNKLLNIFGRMISKLSNMAE